VGQLKRKTFKNVDFQSLNKRTRVNILGIGRQFEFTKEEEG